MQAVEAQGMDPILISLMRQVRDVQVHDGVVAFIFEKALSFYADWLDEHKDALVTLLTGIDASLTSVHYAFQTFQSDTKVKRGSTKTAQAPGKVISRKNTSVDAHTWPKTYCVLQYFPGKVEKVHKS